MRALVVDDDRLTAAIVGTALVRWGFNVTRAHDGREAWDRLQAEPDIGLAILDWMMPGMDGIELCRRIRQEESDRAMYVMLLTSRDSNQDLVAALDAGANDYLRKPFDPEEFRARVHVGLRMMSLQVRLNERLAELQEALSNIKQLQGLLPICSYCKAVRRDQDYWEQVEQYISEHSAIRFSHGICPTCFDKVAAELDESPCER